MGIYLIKFEESLVKRSFKLFYIGFFKNYFFKISHFINARDEIYSSKIRDILTVILCNVGYHLK